MWKISYMLSTLFRQLVVLMRYDSFCFVNRKNTTQCHQLPITKDAVQKHREEMFRQQCGNAPVSRYSVYNKQNTHGWVIEKNMLSVNWMDQQFALRLLISCGCKTHCTTTRCSFLSQGLWCTDGCICSDLYQNKNQRWFDSRFVNTKTLMFVKYIELLPLN
jgi:hypothetical protein